MRYEWLIGLRYLRSTRHVLAPSLITVISVGGVAVGVATLIVVLAVLGGFEGDLREKILGTKAHLRVTGLNEQPLSSPTEVMEVLEGLRGVVGVSPFIESELLVSSPTNYSGMILRGIDPERVTHTSELAENMVEGEIAWLGHPDEARRYRDGERHEDGRMDASDLQDRIRQLLDETEEMEREIAQARDLLRDVSEDSPPAESPSPPAEVDEQSLTERLQALDERISRATDEEGTAGFPLSGDAPVAVPVLDDADHGMPALPPPGGVSEEDTPDHGMPSLPPPSPGASEGRPGTDVGTGMPVAPEPRRPGTIRRTPGIILGSQLRDVLRVDVGDLVNVVSPDGDMGPSGPIPRTRPFRVVGVFHSGLYEFDNRMSYVLLDDATSFLNLPEGEVTGIEVRVAQLAQAPAVARAARTALAEAPVEETSIRDWQELNETLFAALALEKVVMFLILSIIILVASFAIVCMLIVIVIEKSREIAVLRSMGASGRGVLRIFLVEGGIIGLSGTVIGLLLGLGVVVGLDVFGFPLDPEVFYIDRLPVEIRAGEIVTVAMASVTISLLATLYPSVQAARLDPVSGLRYD